MNRFLLKKSLFVAMLLAFALVAALPVLETSNVFAQESNPAADTPVPEPPTNTPVAPTNTPVIAPTSTPVITTDPAPSTPNQIPEPVTVILCGSDLAALSPSVSRKRRKQ